MSKTPPKPSVSNNNKRHYLIRTLRSLIAHNGLENITLVGWAQASGITKNGILYHFPNFGQAIALTLANDADSHLTTADVALISTIRALCKGLSKLGRAKAIYLLREVLR